jgi:hypothetical protein
MTKARASLPGPSRITSRKSYLSLQLQKLNNVLTIIDLHPSINNIRALLHLFFAIVAFEPVGPYREKIMINSIKAKRCNNCTGKGKFVGLGGVGTRNCVECKGIGYLTSEEKSLDLPKEPAPVVKRAYKRRAVVTDFIASEP